ncbi:MAG: hypothetical protein ACRD3N_03695 [Terracidiphilus sp.]
MNRQALVSASIAACLIVLGPNLAQARSSAGAHSSAATMSSHAGSQEAQRMVPARADLVKTLDARNLQAGQQFKAQLRDTIHLKNGPTLPRGTVLVGKVVTDKMNSDGQTSTFALRFTQANLKDGKSVPIKATIVGVYAPEGQSSYGEMGHTPNYWTPQTLQVDQVGVIKGVDLHSKIAANNSGVFVTMKRNDMKFKEGSELAIAVAARREGAGQGMGMGANGGA